MRTSLSRGGWEGRPRVFLSKGEDKSTGKARRSLEEVGIDV